MDQGAANEPQRDHPSEAVSKKPKIKPGRLPEWWYGTDGGEPFQMGLPYTQTPNQFFEWLMYLGLLEIRIVGVVIRLTFGWHRKWTRPLKVSDFIEITSHTKSSVLDALTRLRAYGILDRRRSSRRQPYKYGLIVRDELAELKEVPPAAKQQVLPYNVHALSGSENRTSHALSGSENRTSQTPVLICIKESNTHKERCVSQSKYSREFREQYAAKHSLGIGWLSDSEKGKCDDWIDAQLRRDAETKTTKGETIHERLRREGVI